jgi:DNA polymerase III delta prime subunit
MSLLHAIWCEKYRPTEVEDYLFQDNSQKSTFIKFLLSQSIPHLLLSGIQGTGKSSLAALLIQEMGIDQNDVLTVNGSIENSVEIVREKISKFIMLFAAGDFKIVLVEEADRLSLAAQDGLKDILESHSDYVRFIFTCNHEQKITPALKSRFQHFRFKAHSKANVIQRIKFILDTENIKYDPTLIKDYVDVCYPDIRKTINLVQQNSMSGTLLPIIGTSENAEFQSKLIELMILDQWYEMRDIVLPNLDTEHWEDFYRCVYQNLNRSPKFSDINNQKFAYVQIAEYLYRHSICSDPLINATALVVRLSEV